MIDRSEIRRLQKAARDNNKMALYNWGVQFEEQIKSELDIQYKKQYVDYLNEAIDNFMIATCYTLMYSEETFLSPEKLQSFMSDMLATIDLFRTGEMSPDDYKNQMEEDGFTLSNLNKSKVSLEEQDEKES